MFGNASCRNSPNGLFSQPASVVLLAREGKTMLGAIAGDIIGSAFEFANTKSEDFPLFQDSSMFTDDTVLTLVLFNVASPR